MSGFTPPNGLLAQVTPLAQWNWNTTNLLAPTIISYSNGSQTKTGLGPADLNNFAGVPLVYRAAPPRLMTDSQKIDIIRAAEDYVEQQTGLLLCLTWVASPPARNTFELTQTGMTADLGAQLLGLNYDLEDAPYDFDFAKSQDQGWMELSLRYRPVRKINGQDFSPIKNYAYTYPLLDSFFRVPPTWFVTDSDFAIVRLVPSANVQMLPLFALQLSFGGFSDSLPGALALQYTAGLMPYDYQTRFTFIKQLVLSLASVIAIRQIAGGISMGADSYSTLIDGTQYQVKYGAGGPFSGTIQQFEKQGKELMDLARSNVAGPFIITV